MSQSQFLAIARNLLKARGKPRVQDAISFGIDMKSYKISILKMLR